jgi:hypothetical protein
MRTMQKLGQPSRRRATKEKPRAANWKPRTVLTVGAVLAVGVGLFGGASSTGAGTSKSSGAAAAIPRITIRSPRNGASYQRRARKAARFRCTENGSASAIVSCIGTVRPGHDFNTGSVGTRRFTVTATDISGHMVTKTVRYSVWAYVNPLRAVVGLRASRIDMGVDYSGSGPILAMGRAKVIKAGYFPGPERCWGKTCAPAPGGWVAYRLLDGPFEGKYIYAVENITVSVKKGQIVRQGQRIAVLHNASPNLEIGWAAGRHAETLAVARHHQCRCTDPGGWSSIEGRNFNRLLVWLGGPPGYPQQTPRQHMPRHWPRLPRRDLNR